MNRNSSRTSSRLAWIFAVALAHGCTADIDLGDSDGGRDATTPSDAAANDASRTDANDASRNDANVDAGGCDVCDSPPADRCLDDATLQRFAAVGSCVDGACTYDSQTERCAAGCAGGRCADDACLGVTCDSPPAPVCRDANRLVLHDLGGECSRGTCDYPSREVVCPDGCEDGRCRPSACGDASCDMPPGQCFESIGACVDGTCRYDQRPGSARCDDGDPCTTVDSCDRGECRGSPMRCDNPPPSVCVDANTLRVHAAVGSCAAGRCEYAPSERRCPFGCSNGACERDSCAGVVCDRPPSPGACYASRGTCENGECRYAFVDSACDDGNACTTSDRCASGVCRGSALTCDMPPADVCIGSSTVRRYASVGSCGAGGCDYAPNDVACAANEICALGRCAPRCGFVDSSRTLGASSDAILPPAIAHRAANDTFLVVWVDVTRKRVIGELHTADGTVIALPDLGGYAADPSLSPFSAATVVADDRGFGIVWVEHTLESGVNAYRLRYVDVDFTGVVLARSVVPSGLRLQFTDVDPRLFAIAGARLLVYRGRDAGGVARVVARTLGGPTEVIATLDNASPASICLDGAPVLLHEDRGTVRLQRARYDGSLEDSIAIDAPTGTSGTLRCAAAADGFYIARGATVFRVRDDGSRFGDVTTLARPVLGLFPGNGEAAILTRGNGGLALTRIAESGAVLGTVELDAPRTGVEVGLDAAAWSGAQWIVGWSHDEGLADRARMTRVCQPSR